jgi:hypothetical protein
MPSWKNVKLISKEIKMILAEQYKEIRDMVKKFSDSEVLPLAMKIDHEVGQRRVRTAAAKYVAMATIGRTHLRTL